MAGVKEVGMHVRVVGGNVGLQSAGEAEDRPAGPYVESLVNPS